MILRRTAAAAFLLVAGNVLPLAAQPSAVVIPQLNERVEVSIVNVDVFVTDKKGNRVRGLTSDDFEIREAGRLQPITNFAEYTPAQSEAVSVSGGVPAQAAQAAPHAKRTIVLFIESFKVPTFDAKPTFDAIRDLLRRTVRPGDAVTVVSWSNLMKVRLGFTDDLRAIEKTLGTVEAESIGANPLESRLEWALAEDEMIRSWEASRQAAAIARGIRDTKRIDAESNRALAMLEHYKMKQKAAAIEALMQSIAAVEGRKIVILAMNRFGLYAGADFYAGAVPFDVRPDLDTSAIRNSVVRTANQNNITLYTFYPAGLGWTPSTSADAAPRPSDARDNAIVMNETIALREIAAATGGASGWGRADMVKLLPRIGDDLDSYYSLAYRVSSQKIDEVRPIRVTVRKPGYTVRARQQYVEKSDATKMKDRVVAGLFLKPDDRSSIPIRAMISDPVKSSRKRWNASLSIQVPIASLTAVPEGVRSRGAFSVFVASGNAVGAVNDVVQRTQEFTIDAKDMARASTSHFTYEFQLELDRVTKRVSVGVMDEVSKEFGLFVVPVPERQEAE